MDNFEEKAVRKLVENYMQGTFQADITLLRKCFHPQAVMNGFLNDQKIFGRPELFFQDMASHPSMAQGNAPYKGAIAAIDIVGNIASVILKETGFAGGLALTNYFHLVKENGAWSIISKTFTTE